MPISSAWTHFSDSQSPSLHVAKQRVHLSSLPVIKLFSDQILPDRHTKSVSTEEGELWWWGAPLWCHYKQACSWELSYIHLCVQITSITLWEWIRAPRQWLNKGVICKRLSVVISTLRLSLVGVGWTCSGELFKHRVICLVALSWAQPVIMVSLPTPISESTTCQLLVNIKQILFYYTLWLSCSFSHIGVRWFQTQKHWQQDPGKINMMYLPKVSQILLSYFHTKLQKYDQLLKHTNRTFIFCRSEVFVKVSVSFSTNALVTKTKC